MKLDPCSKARSHFSEHLDGEPLPWKTRLLVQLHLTICPPCRRVARSLEATCEALHALRDEKDDPAP
jgi:predicted anti-sigma-YlaC factor YlaD